MRQLAATVFLGGCSFIFNPDHINRDIDAHVDDAYVVDVEVIADVDITALNLDYAYPATVYEGAGQANGRPSVVVIRGEQISPTAVVTVVPATGAPSQITVNDIKIAGDSNWIAISISAPVDTNQDATGGKMKPPVPLIVTVDNGGGNVKSLPTAALSLTFLDQLTTPVTAPLPDPKKLFSNIAIATSPPFAAGVGRIELHSTGGISFTQTITLSATTTAPGPGGCGVGTSAGSPGLTTSAGDGAACVSTAAATGAGGPPGKYGGDAQISSFANATPGGGGGGGQTAGLLGGSVGGAGAGMLSLEANGDITIMNGMTGKGGAGAGAGLGLGGSGGGGAGATVLLRSGGTLGITGAVALDGGLGGTAGAPGAAGMVGHTRYDAAHGSATSDYVGPMFQTVPYFSYDALTLDNAITVTGTGGDNTVTGQAFDKDLDAPLDGKFDLSFSGAGVARPRVMLSPGYNLICATVPNGNVLQRPESGNCAEIAYLPGPHS